LFFLAHFAYDKEFARSHSYEWQRIKSRPIPFSIAGIPFVMQFEVPVELGYEVRKKKFKKKQFC